MNRFSWLLRRLASLLFTMLAVTFLAFAAFDLIPGSPAQAILGLDATPERVAALAAELGLDRPLPVRYGEWLLGFFTGNLGQSLSYRQEVGQLLGGKAAVTLLLSVISFALIVTASIPLALLSARFTDGTPEVLHTFVNQFCMAVPPFFTGILLSWLFGLVLRVFQPGAFPGLGQPGALRFLFFAAVCIAIPRSAMTVRMLRGTILTELEKDYIRTALSRGNTLAGILWRHVLKNALCPTITFLAQTMAESIAGGIVVEQVFAIPGLGRMLVVSIANRDYPVVQAIVVILAFWVVLSATAADLVNAWIDPRLRLGEK